MDHSDKIPNPVEQYLKDLMDSDKPEKPPETVSQPTSQLNIKGDVRNSEIIEDQVNSEAQRVSEVLKRSINRNKKNIFKTESVRINKNGEERIFDIRRHPVGLLIIFLTGLIGYAAIFSLVSFLLPGLAEASGYALDTVGPIVGSLMLVAVLIGIIIFAITVRTYKANRLLLTDVSLIQVSSFGLFKSNVHEIALTDVDNIVWKRQGKLSAFFDYGLLNINTTPGHNDIIFKYAPTPGISAKAIQDAKLQYLADHRVNHL